MPITAFEFSPDSKYIYSAALDNSIKKWDINTGELMHTQMGLLAPVMSLDISNCGNQLYCNSKDLVLNIWDLNTNKLVKREEYCASKSKEQIESLSPISENSTPSFVSMSNREEEFKIFSDDLIDKFEHHLDSDSDPIN